MCVDVPRKRRGKQPQGTQVINGLTIHPVPLDPSPSIPSNTNNNNNNNNATTEDGSPIDELSDFLFDGIENNLLTDSNLRNMALLEGSSLSVNTLLNTRPLFANSNSSYSISPYISTLSPQTSSSDVSPVPSPYNANSSNDSPSHEINYSNPLNYTSNYLSPNGESTNPNSYTTHINNNLYTNLSNQAYSTSNTYPTPTFDTESINDHINNLLSGHIPVSSTSSSSELSSSTSTSTSTATAVITPINLPLSPQTSSTSNSSTSHQWPENTSPLQSVPDIVTYDIPVNNNNIIPTNTGIVDRLATYENPNQEEIPNGNSDDFKKIDSFIPKCFCHQVHRPGKVQLVCVHEKPQPGYLFNCIFKIFSYYYYFYMENYIYLFCFKSGAVSKCESVEPVNTQTSLHLVVESLVREVQNLKRELRGEQPPRSLSVSYFITRLFYFGLFIFYCYLFRFF